MNVSDELRLLAAGLEDGDNLYTVCPSCEGKGKFSIKLEDGLAIYNCFRPTCALHGGGAFRITQGDLVRTKSKPVEKDTTWRGVTEPLPDSVTRFYESHYHLDIWHVAAANIRWCADEQRAIWPMMHRFGYVIGYVRKLIQPLRNQPKSLTSPNKGHGKLSWYPQHSKGIGAIKPTDTVMVVEDVISAVRASRYTNAVSLNGSSMSIDEVTEVAGVYKNVLWALDKDATSTAIAMHKRYRLLFHSSQVVMLEQDIKNMQEPELAELMRRYL